VQQHSSLLQHSERCSLILPGAAWTDILQYAALCSSIQRYGAIFSSMLRHGAICSRTLWYAQYVKVSSDTSVTVQHKTLQYAKLISSTLHFDPACCSMLQHTQLCCNSLSSMEQMLWYVSIWFSMFVTFRYTHTCPDKHHCTQISIRCPNMHQYAPVVEVRLQTPVDNISLSVPSWGSNKFDSHYPSRNGAVQ
jgi:hypothetical protein